MNEDLDRLAARVGQVVEQAREQAEDAAEPGWMALGLSIPDRRPPVVEVAAKGYPFGKKFNFGIKIVGAVVTVYASVCYRGGVAITTTETAITITTDGDWVAVQAVPGETPGTDVATIVRWPAWSVPQDHSGLLVSGLHRFAFASGVASWAFSTKWGGDFGMMGH